MAGCCNPRGCEVFFSNRFARRVAKRYRKRGLDKPAQQMVEFLQSRGLGDATVLEIGGGVGEIQLELLSRGAAQTVNLELSPAYEEEATRLVREAGVEGRVDRRLHDIAVDPAGSSRSTSSCSTASSAATPTTSGCSARRPTTPGGCWSSATHHGI